MATKGDLDRLVAEFRIGEREICIPDFETNRFWGKVRQIGETLRREQGIDWRHFLMLSPSTTLDGRSGQLFQELRNWLGHHGAKPSEGG